MLSLSHSLILSLSLSLNHPDGLIETFTLSYTERVPIRRLYGCTFDNRQQLCVGQVQMLPLY